jgi:ribosomal protein S18 acetylase RimI-like enzyme
MTMAHEGSIMAIINKDSQILIRKMVAEDYPDAYALWQKTPGMHLRESEDSFEEIARLIKCNPGFCFVAEIDQQIVGTILGATDGRRGKIYHLAVATNYQHDGIGSQLVNKVIKELQEVGIHKISVVVMINNQAGKLFWQKLKFAKRTDIEHFDKII